ncbi:Flagellar motility protein MotE, a chaperone for MotC folding [Desulfonatronum thiosulfatophilum]|uniref:Flagellar motility protein MotE, a chaperone for MotC folding n=1 Tax=Desulfonatronum thiosulfatophilum TaxID=617002 RepID=A0A1G6CSI2_9BACT|nr:Flagellar motility protein MotE, a chaperone for MotC folding [Desulfonatronum thiosulfatophilum]
MKWRPFGTSLKVSSLLAGVAVLSLTKLVFLAVWSGIQPADYKVTSVAQAALAAPSPAYAQLPASEIPGAWNVAQQGGDPQQFASQGNLSEEWQNLRRRQEELQRKEQALQALERELDAKLNRLQQLENRLQTMLDEADVLRDGKIKHLVDVYSNMKPREAAKALEALEEPVAVKILSGMRGRSAGEVLSFVDAERAARLTEALTRIHIPLQ